MSSRISSASRPDPVASYTGADARKKGAERQNERDFLEALGEYKCDTGVSVENVPAVFNIKAVKGGFIAHKFSTGWTVGVVKSVEQTKSVAGKFSVKYKSETYCWTKTLNKENYGVDKYWVLLDVVKE